LINHGGERCLVTIDGVDFLIYEPSPFDRKWYSHKFGSAGLRYELAIIIKMGMIAAITGPFECGRWPDIKIFRYKLKQMLTPGEKVVADRGYRGDTKILTPGDAISFDHYNAMNKARARHETVNGRIKTWGICKFVYRHDIKKHHLVVRGAAVIEMLKMQLGDGPFQVGDLEDPILL